MATTWQIDLAEDGENSQQKHRYIIGDNIDINQHVNVIFHIKCTPEHANISQKKKTIENEDEN